MSAKQNMLHIWDVFCTCKCRLCFLCQCLFFLMPQLLYFLAMFLFQLSNDATMRILHGNQTLFTQSLQHQQNKLNR